MKIVVTIPAYNEELTIGKVVGDIRKVSRSLAHKTEVVVVDDGSSDGTASAAKKAGAIVHSQPKNYGLAEAFRAEVELALKRKADVIVHTDADGQYVAEEIPLLLRKVMEGNDLVLGSRFRGRIESMPPVKRLGNRLFSLIVSYIIKQKISDAQTGFRAFTRRLAQQTTITSAFTYTQDQIIAANRKKFRIAEVPVTFRKREGQSRLMKNSFDYAIRGGLNLVRLFRDYAPITFFGSIGIALILIGVVIGSWLVYRFLEYGAIGRTPSLILSVALVITGLQFILFGFYADSKRK